MYEYRQGRIPLYVPPGHSILFATVYWLGRDPAVRRHARAWTAGMYALAAAYSAAWLVARNDVYGWLCFAVFSAIIAVTRESRLFFLAMYLLVAFLEQVGTSLGCWWWPSILLGKVALVPSANPPSGIASFYFGLDVLCLISYLATRPRLKARRRAAR
jgi:murein endopeptidase